MSLGALTTTFTPPASCLDQLTGVSYNGTVYYQGPAVTSDCFPENYAFARTNYYSPGRCPEGYSSVSPTVSRNGAIRETIVTCCPPNMVPNTETEAWAATLGCSSSFDIATFSPLTIIADGTSVSTKATVEPGGALNAYSIQIRFQSTDFQTTGDTTAALPTATNGTSADEGSPGLNTAAIVGIAIGATGMAILLAMCFAGVFYLGRRSTRQKKEAQANELLLPSPYPTPTPGSEHQYSPVPNKDSYTSTVELSGWSRPSEVSGWQPPEVSGYSRPSEVSGYSQPAEMPDHSQPAEMPVPGQQDHPQQR